MPMSYVYAQECKGRINNLPEDLKVLEHLLQVSYTFVSSLKEWSGISA